MPTPPMKGTPRKSISHVPKPPRSVPSPTEHIPPHGPTAPTPLRCAPAHGTPTTLTGLERMGGEQRGAAGLARGEGPSSPMPAQGCLLRPPCRAVHPQLQPSRGGGDTGAPAAALPVLPSRAPPAGLARGAITPRGTPDPQRAPHPAAWEGGEPEGREGQGPRCPTRDRQTDRDRQADSACGDAAPPVPAPTGPPSGGGQPGGDTEAAVQGRCSRHGVLRASLQPRPGSLQVGGPVSPPTQPPPAPHIHQHWPPPRCRQPALRSTGPPGPRRWVQGWCRGTSVGTAGACPCKCAPPPPRTWHPAPHCTPRPRSWVTAAPSTGKCRVSARRSDPTRCDSGAGSSVQPPPPTTPPIRQGRRARCQHPPRTHRTPPGEHRVDPGDQVPFCPAQARLSTGSGHPGTASPAAAGTGPAAHASALPPPPPPGPGTQPAKPQHRTLSIQGGTGCRHAALGSAPLQALLHPLCPAPLWRTAWGSDPRRPRAAWQVADPKILGQAGGQAGGWAAVEAGPCGHQLLAVGLSLPSRCRCRCRGPSGLALAGPEGSPCRGMNKGMAVCGGHRGQGRGGRGAPRAWARAGLLMRPGPAGVLRPCLFSP